jgi:K+-transporting ATPase ATPase A chain
MSTNAIQAGLFVMVVALLVKPVGTYLEHVFERRHTWLDPMLLPIERLIHRCVGINSQSEMDWKRYSFAFCIFGLVNIVLLYFALRWQAAFPWFFPKVVATPMTQGLAANTAVSFATTTTWQAYAGETTMSYFSQLLLAGQNFLAGAAGLAVGVAFIRGYARERTTELGNFWFDLIRAVLWVLLPVSLIGSLFLIPQGVPMNFRPYAVAHTLEGATQVIAQGPVAALEFIKNLGTNGGGFFNANGAHPFENPTPLTNFVELLAIVVIPAAFTHTFGRMVGRPRDGWVIFWTMTALFVVGLLVCNWAETSTHPALASHVVGGNMEGKEVRFGTGASALAAVVTSNGATGSYNSMVDSFQPLGVAVPLLNMLIGEIVYGGLGTGLYSMIFIALIALFVGGLMIGRTPEHLGKPCRCLPRGGRLYLWRNQTQFLAFRHIACAMCRKLSSVTTKIFGVTDTKLRCSFSTTPASRIMTSTIPSSEKPELPTHFIMLGHAKRRDSFRSSCSVCASQSWSRLSAICFVQAMAGTETLR